MSTIPQCWHIGAVLRLLSTNFRTNCSVNLCFMAIKAILKLFHGSKRVILNVGSLIKMVAVKKEPQWCWCSSYKGIFFSLNSAFWHYPFRTLEAKLMWSITSSCPPTILSTSASPLRPASCVERTLMCQILNYSWNICPTSRVCYSLLKASKPTKHLPLCACVTSPKKVTFSNLE